MKLIQKKYSIFLEGNSEEWIETLKIGIKPLIDDGVIDNLWIEKLIKTNDELGPYFVFSEYLAMPHISPDSSSKKTATGFIYCQNPVKFTGKGLEKYSKIIVPLISTDGNNHMELLSEIVSKWNNKEFIEKLKNIFDYNSFCEFIEEVENGY